MLIDIRESLPQLVDSNLFKKGMNFYDSNSRSYAGTTTQIYETWHLVKDFGLVYIVNVGADYYKIGTTTDLRQRFTSFQTSNPFVINSNQLVAAIEPPWDKLTYPSTSDAYALESWLHNLLKDKRHMNSEIFKLSQEDMQNLFEKMKENDAKNKHWRHKKHRVVGTILPRTIVRGLLRAVPYKSKTKKHRVNPRLKRVSECQLTRDSL